MDTKWCWQTEIGLPKPDLVLLLTTPFDKAATRLTYGEERYEKKSFQQKVFANYFKMIDLKWQV